MNKLEKYLVDLLQHNIMFNDKEVPVTKHYSQDPVLPLITLDLSNSPTTFKVYREGTDVETVYFHRSAQIDINVWCNTEEERQSVNKQILCCFYKEQSNYYEYCTYYDKEICLNLRTRCKCLTMENSRSIKHKCPLPDEFGYECLSDKHNLVWGSVNIEPPFDLDEVNEHPPILRSVMRCEGEYIDSHVVGGKTVDSVDYDVEIIVKDTGD